MHESYEENEEGSLRQQKLRYEVEALRRSLDPWYRRPLSLVSAIAAMFVLLAAIAGFFSKAAEVARTEAKLDESKRSLKDAQIQYYSLQSRLDTTSTELKRANTLLENRQEQVRDFESSIQSLERDLTKLTLQRDSLTAHTAQLKEELVQLQEDIDKHQNLMESLAAEAISGSPDHSGLESLARDAIQLVYDDREAEFKEMVRLFNDPVQSHVIFSEGQTDYFRKDIDQLRAQIHEMETLYPWLKH
jgi:chromosome segregation ATPase